MDEPILIDFEEIHLVKYLIKWKFFFSILCKDTFQFFESDFDRFFY